MSYEEINSILEEFINEDNISEKIMTKKQAKRKKTLRAKRRAEKLARQQAEQKKLLQQAAQKSEPDTIEAELVDDGGDNNNGNNNNDNKDSEDDNKPKEFKPLIVYEPNRNVQETYTDYSDAFKEFIKLLNDIIQKYSPMWEKANQIWESKGKDKPCPQDAYDLFKEAIDGCQKDVLALINNTYPSYADKMRLEENEFLNAQFTALNKFLEDMGKHINSIHPENIDTPSLPDNTDIKTTDGKSTNDVISTDTSKTKVDKTKKEKDVPNILTQKDWAKLTHDTSMIWKEVTDNQKKLAGLKWLDFVKNGFHPLDWFTDRIWSFINSAVVNDFVKTLMYSNPITAMLYDGKLIDFGIKDGLKAVQAECQKQRQERDQNKANKEKEKHDKSFYNKRGIPKDVSKCSLKELQNEFYGNTYFIDWVNMCFHHPNIDAHEQIEVKNLVRKVGQAFKANNRQDAIKSFTTLCNKLNELGDVLKIETADDFDTACEEALGADNILSRKQSADARKQVLQRKSKENERKKSKSNQYNQQLLGEIKSLIKLKKTDDDIFNSLKNDSEYSNYKDDYLKKHIETAHKSISMNTSYIETVTKNLQQLCENALA